jgi:hypothetical protein
MFLGIGFSKMMDAWVKPGARRAESVKSGGEPP